MKTLFKFSNNKLLFDGNHQIYYTEAIELQLKGEWVFVPRSRGYRVAHFCLAMSLVNLKASLHSQKSIHLQEWSYKAQDTLSPSYSHHHSLVAGMDVPIAANVLGTIGAVCWSIQVSPPPCPSIRSVTAIPQPYVETTKLMHCSSSHK